MHVYIDGESHFIRTEQAVKEVFDASATLESMIEQIETKQQEHLALNSFYALCFDRRCKFFWTDDAVDTVWNRTKTAPDCRVYFTSFSGDEDTLHSLKVKLRNYGFEPQIVKEVRSLAKQRGTTLGNDGIIEKPKGVDIALSVRMLEDAHRGAFQECILFTSDVDYIPVIEAVQRMGKRVCVYGYRNGIGKNSAMEYVPFEFLDLTQWIEAKKSWLEDGAATKQISEFIQKNKATGGA